MRIGSVVVALVVSAAVSALAPLAAGCSKSDKPARKLRKMDVHATIDDRGRLRLSLRLFDTKHEQMAVTGSYTGEVAKLDGTVLCKAAGELAPSDFSDKGVYKAPWHDAQCPEDPGVDELRVTVRVTPKGKDAGKDGKDEDKGAKDGDKDGKDGKAKDGSLERVLTLPVKSVYERPPVKKPAEAGSAAGSGSGSAAGSGTGSAGSAAAESGAGSAAGSGAGSAGSAAVPAEKPAEKAAEQPAEKKPGESKAPSATKSSEKVPLKKWRTGTTDGSESVTNR